MPRKVVLPQIQRATLREIAQEMRESEYSTSGSESFGFKILDEELWTLDKRVYRPLATVSLPILYGGVDLDDGGEKLTRVNEVLTVFDDSFFKGYFLNCPTKGLPTPCEDGSCWDSQKEEGLTFHTEEDNKDPELVLRKHLAKFFTIYSSAKNHPAAFGLPSGDKRLSQLVRKCVREDL